MAHTPCRDCGTPLATGAGGCPTCGRNIVAERAVARALAWSLFPAVVLIAVGLVWLLRG